MSRNFSIAAYLALNRVVEVDVVQPDAPPRPAGRVIWARCASAEQLMAVQTIRQKFADDGEDIELISTHPDGTIPHPMGTRSVRRFLNYWKPDLVLWLDTVLDAATLQVIAQTQTKALLLQADATALDHSEGRRFPRLFAAMLNMFEQLHCLTVDNKLALDRAGADTKRTIVTGKLEETIVPAPYQEDMRASLAACIGPRPVWLAVRVPMSELKHIAAAHRIATRRSHRTLLILRPRRLADAPQMARELREAGFNLVCRSDGADPQDTTQIYLADMEQGIGLWSRLAPVTYLGGSLSDGDLPDPFQPATVGSALICGPCRSSHIHQVQRLAQASALHEVGSVTGLGPAVEALISTDAAAKLAHAAWDVTSRGAEETDALVQLIYDLLDQVNGTENARA